MCRSQISKRNNDPICLEDIAKFDEDWILEDDPQVLNVEENNRCQKGLVPNDKEICNAIVINGDGSLPFLSFQIFFIISYFVTHNCVDHA
jgi:hypothetical protein